MANIAPGTYRVLVNQAVLATSKKGLPQVVIDFVLETGEVFPIKYYGGFAFDFIDYTFKAMETCGWDMVDLKNLSMMPKTQVDLVITDYTPKDGGATNSQIKYINQPGRVSGVKPMEDGDMAKFLKDVRGPLAAYKKKHPAAKPALSSDALPV